MFKKGRKECRVNRNDEEELLEENIDMKDWQRALRQDEKYSISEDNVSLIVDWYMHECTLVS